jgi:hypothetical protein
MKRLLVAALLLSGCGLWGDGREMVCSYSPPGKPAFSDCRMDADCVSVTCRNYRPPDADAGVLEALGYCGLSEIGGSCRSHEDCQPEFECDDCRCLKP